MIERHEIQYLPTSVYCHGDPLSHLRSHLSLPSNSLTSSLDKTAELHASDKNVANQPYHLNSAVPGICGGQGVILMH